MYEDEMGWKCGKCGKLHSTTSNLKKVKAVDTDMNPSEQHGFVSVCDCGYTFFKDKWCLKTKLSLRECVIEVSTIDLELNHGGYWYETMVFIVENKSGFNITSNISDRYKTKEEAIKGHNKIIKELKFKEYVLRVTEYRLEIGDN